MVSPDEAFRSAQSRASNLARQRREQRNQRPRQTPKPTHKVGNITGSSRVTPGEARPELPKSRTGGGNANVRNAPSPASMPKKVSPPKPHALPNNNSQSGEHKDTQSARRHDESATKKHQTSHGKKTEDKHVVPPQNEQGNSDTTKARKNTQERKVPAQAHVTRHSAPQKLAVRKSEPKPSDKDTVTLKKPQASSPPTTRQSVQSPGNNVTSHRNNDKKKEEKERLFSPKSRAEIITSDVDESQFDVVSSSNDLGDIKKSAHLSESDVNKISDAYSDYKVTQQVRSNGKKVEKLPRMYVVIPRKKKIFKVLTSIWTICLVIALACLFGYGYTVYKDASLGKEKDAAYAEGVKSSGKEPDISSLMKLNNQQISDKIVSAQGVNFPPNAKVDSFSLVGWTSPGGNQKESKVEVDFCYSGDGQKKSRGSVFFYTPDAVSTAPEWTVDTVSLTQVPCQ